MSGLVIEAVNYLKIRTDRLKSGVKGGSLRLGGGGEF
jgi:hypothetical protein